MVYGFGPAAPLAYFRQLTSHFAHDEATMSLLLAFSSFAWSSLFGKDKRYEKKGLVHLAKGIQLVNQRLQDANQCVSESNIQAAMIMSAIEVRLTEVDYHLWSQKH